MLTTDDARLVAGGVKEHARALCPLLAVLLTVLVIVLHFLWFQLSRPALPGHPRLYPDAGPPSPGHAFHGSLIPGPAAFLRDAAAAGLAAVPELMIRPVSWALGRVATQDGQNDWCRVTRYEPGELLSIVCPFMVSTLWRSGIYIFLLEGLPKRDLWRSPILALMIVLDLNLVSVCGELLSCVCLPSTLWLSGIYLFLLEGLPTLYTQFVAFTLGLRGVIAWIIFLAFCVTIHENFSIYVLRREFDDEIKVNLLQTWMRLPLLVAIFLPTTVRDAMIALAIFYAVVNTLIVEPPPTTLVDGTPISYPWRALALLALILPPLTGCAVSALDVGCLGYIVMILLGELSTLLWRTLLWTLAQLHLTLFGKPANVSQCKICLSDDMSLVVLYPCLHRGACKHCMDQISRGSSLCPFCRTPVEGCFALESVIHP